MTSKLISVLAAIIAALQAILTTQGKVSLGHAAHEHADAMGDALRELQAEAAKKIESTGPGAAPTVAVGRIVHFVMGSGQHRPAIIVNNWGNKLATEGGCAVNLRVFADGSNDSVRTEDSCTPAEECQTSVTYSDQHGARTWHWPERE